MVVDLAGYGLSMFLVLCRIGACLMVMPGFSSARVPSRVRLFIAIALSTAVTPMILAGENIGEKAAIDLAPLIFNEVLIGSIIGLVSRVYIAALEFTGASISSYIGLQGLNPGIETDDAAPALSLLITATATLLVLLMDLHQVLITTLISSYSRMPIAASADPQTSLHIVTTAIQTAFFLGLQVSGPFIVYGILVNIMFAILGKLIPQVPSFFVSVPFLIGGGLVVLHLLVGEMLLLFGKGIADSLAQL